MASGRKNSDGTIQRRAAPAVDPEARENQMISLATDAAERELQKDNPDKRIVIHYLKLATTKAQLEKEKLRKENSLLEVKTDAVKSSAKTEEMYAEAIKAMQLYQGSINRGDE